MRVTNHINKSKMKVRELIEALSHYDDDGEIDGEGYVMWNRWGIYKLVNRNQFSRLNFLTNNNWVSS